MRTMLKSMLALCVAALVFPASAADTDGIKQPVFVMVPHVKKYSAWSLYVVADKKDPSKLLSFGLEKLVGKNSEDLSPNGFENVVAAQQDPKTQRENLGILDASQFGSGQIRVDKDDALHTSLTPVGPDTYRLMVSMRIAADKRFTIGGKEQGKRDVLIKYDKATKSWGACATTMKDAEGKSIVENGCKPITGIVFPVTGTGIYRVVGVIEGEPVVLLDR
ncbi:MAG TPA: hypothetical protein VEK08_00230 [Planctomycetota bacterium]|nr:hypothetical protein [Planctomycetota bacterium]